MIELKIRIDDIDPDEINIEDIDSGISQATCSVQMDIFRRLGDESPALDAWDKLMTEVTTDLAPKVHTMVVEAIRARLPWTWEA